MVGDKVIKMPQCVEFLLVAVFAAYLSPSARAFTVLNSRLGWRSSSQIIPNLGGFSNPRHSHERGNVLESDSLGDEAHDLGCIDENHSSSWAEIGLPSWLCDRLMALGFEKPSRIQSAVIPSIMSGKDVVVQAETGSGKTFCYLLPALARLDRDKTTTQAIIVVPTRELALQVFVTFGIRNRLSKHLSTLLISIRFQVWQNSSRGVGAQKSEPA